MAEQNTEYVGIGKPNVTSGGAVWWAPYGAEVPTDGTTALADDFVCVGYISDDGFVESTSTDTEDKNAWGGDLVARPQTSYSKEYSVTLLETTADSLRLVWGEDAVEADEDGKLQAVTHSTKQRGYISLVVEYALSDSQGKRTVVPRAQVSEVGDITHSDGEIVSYELTITAFPVGGEVSKDYYFETVG